MIRVSNSQYILKFLNHRIWVFLVLRLLLTLQCLALINAMEDSKKSEIRLILPGPMGACQWTSAYGPPPPLLLLLAFILMPSLFRPYVFCFSSFFWDFFSFCASSSSALGTCALFPWGSSQCGRGARGRSSAHGLCKLCAISSELGSPSCARWPNRLHLSP